LNDKVAGFGVSTNKVTFITKTEVIDNELKSKTEVAEDLITQILKQIDA
jgi:phosphopantothenoylcysteine decarboxylase/phosphopantothenate--cysteine ligase